VSGKKLFIELVLNEFPGYTDNEKIEPDLFVADDTDRFADDEGFEKIMPKSKRGKRGKLHLSRMYEEFKKRRQPSRLHGVWGMPGK
jgi:hypothetical protein